MSDTALINPIIPNNLGSADPNNLGHNNNDNSNVVLPTTFDGSKFNINNIDTVVYDNSNNISKDPPDPSDKIFDHVIEYDKDQINDELEDDNASVLVIILQCETKSCDANIVNLKWVFSDPYFTVQVCAVDPPNGVIVKTLTKSQYLENYYMRKSLTYAAEGPYIANSQGILEPQFWWSKIPVIIVKDSSVSNITASGVTDQLHKEYPEDRIIGGMKRRIKIALDKAREADLFFLCKWHDACNKYIDVEGVSGVPNSSTLKWSIQPTATQAIMYVPSSRDYIRRSLVTTTVPLSDLLNTNISKGKLLATVFVPNIIDFDIELATSNEDYNKLNECAPVHASNERSTNISTFVWLTVIIILVIIVAWALIQLGSR